jgi:hypothetical protein
MILADGATEPLTPGDGRAAEVADYVERLSEGFGTTFARGERGGLMHLQVV